MSKLTVTYIKHSGFLIETANSYLLFDYWQGKLPELQYDKELYIFSSHAHHDHYTRKTRAPARTEHKTKTGRRTRHAPS